MTTLPDATSIIAFFAVAHFMLSYHLLAAWWEKPEGRNVMSWCGCALGFLTVRMAVLLFGIAGVWLDLLRALLFAAVAFVAYRRLILLYRAQFGRAPD